jgi:pyruvate kinase
MSATGHRDEPGPRTKLICTLGPSTSTVERIRELVEAGASVFRVNLSHGTAEEQATRVRMVRRVEADSGATLAIMADLPGPKVRLGDLQTPSLRLHAGQRFVLRAGGGPGDEQSAPVSYAGLSHDVHPGDRVMLADGAVDLVVTEVDDSGVVTEVTRGGLIRARAGVNVPAERLSLPAIGERDSEGLRRVLDLGVTFVAQSFVRSADDLRELRSLMEDRPVPIVAKIETRPAVESADAILQVADALMVARGDLGVEMPMEEIPVLQKELLASARQAAIPAIVATQMLESMIRGDRPTRAEASDVANAVLDGADAILLSGETAIGDHPVAAATAAARIAAVAEQRAGRFQHARPECHHTDEAAAVTHAAAQVAAGDPEVVAIACFTRTGRTANLLSAERPNVPVYAFVPDGDIREGLCLRWGVSPLQADVPPDTDAMIGLMDRGLQAAGVAGEGQAIVMVASSPVGKSHTNLLKVHRVGSPVH